MLPRFALLTALAAACLASSPATARSPYAEGQRVEITGTVIDPRGHGVEGVTVALRASRVGWSFGAVNLRDRGRTVKDTTERKTVTDAHGRFTLEWRWHDYYNRFHLVAGRTVRHAGRDRFEELAEVDLTRRIRQGTPVVTSLTVGNAERIEARERFAEAASSRDETRVLDELGQPEKVDVFDHPDHQEVTWWYFRMGRAYRFHDGNLKQVIPFEPVKPF